MRSAAQAARVAATGDEALAVNGGGAGPVSAEWMVPKALWLRDSEPAVYEAAHRICEYQAGGGEEGRGELDGRQQARASSSVQVTRGMPAFPARLVRQPPQLPPSAGACQPPTPQHVPPASPPPLPLPDRTSSTSS